MNAFFSEGDWKSCLSSSAAERYVDALSDMTSLGMDFLLAKRRNAWMNVSSVKSVTTPRCIARNMAQVKRQMYSLASDPWRSSTNSAPVKSTL